MSTKHTPGTWESIVPPSCLLTTRHIETEHGELIASVGVPGVAGVGTIQNVANARLIAAAPELLALAMYPGTSLAHDALSEALESATATAQEIREAAITMCLSLNRLETDRAKIIAKATAP